jgi:hypothetical protein
VDIGKSRVDALEAISGLTVTIEVTNIWRAKLGMFVLKLAARILRCPIRLER